MIAAAEVSGETRLITLINRFERLMHLAGDPGAFINHRCHPVQASLPDVSSGADPLPGAVSALQDLLGAGAAGHFVTLAASELTTNSRKGIHISWPMRKDGRGCTTLLMSMQTPM